VAERSDEEGARRCSPKEINRRCDILQILTIRRKKMLTPGHRYDQNKEWFFWRRGDRYHLPPFLSPLIKGNVMCGIRIRNKVVACGVAAFVFAFMTSHDARANLIVNGDFESISAFFANPGTPVTTGGWTFENHAGVVASDGNPGNRVRLESSGNTTWDPTIAQTVAGL
jgi:hypothetical protein